MKKLTILFAFLLLVGFQAIAQMQITGTVTSSEDGLSIPGVSVVVQGNQTIGTTTDIDGKYSLTVPGSAEALVFSFVGMKTQVIAINGQSVIDVRMDSEVLEMGEVVVTAIGISRETKALGYSAQGVSGDDLVKAGESNIIQSLSSKAAGISVVSSAGTPGASSKILIRGVSSFTTENQPLIIVDGIPIDNTTVQSAPRNYPFNENLQGVNAGNRALDINPEDIESVTILKGPAAAALYGVRAGNGAIVYTTKKGKAGDVKVDYSYNMKLSTVNKLPEFQYKYVAGDWNGNDQSTATYIAPPDFGPNGINDIGGGDDVSIGTMLSWGPTFDSMGMTPTKNVDEFFQTGKGERHSFSISGGSNKTTMRLSFSHLDDEGIIPATYLKRTTARLSINQQFTDKFKATSTMAYTKTGGNRAQNGSNISGIALGLFRTPASFDLNDDENGYMFPNGQQRMYYVIYDNPYYSAYKNAMINDLNRLMGSITLDYQFTDWLSATYKVGADAYSDDREGHFAIGAMGNNYGEGEAIHNTLTNEEYNSDLLISGNHSFTEKINTSLTVGGNVNQRTYSDFYAHARGLVLQDYYNLDNGLDQYTSEYASTIRTSALYFDMTASYDNFIYLGVTGRNEWSSTFGPNQNSFFYPSASLSLLFSELLPENDILTFGKIRYAYAQVGKAPPVYSSKTYYSTPTMTDGFTDGFGFPFNGQNGYSYSSVLGDPNLKPEKVIGHEIGIDLRFFNGRINLDFAYYNQKTVDILLSRPVAGSSGYTSVYSNAGEMVNKGIELVLGGDIIKSKDFIWNFTANFSKNESEVLKLAEGVPEVSAESAFTEIGSYAIVGQPYGSFYGSRWARNSDGNIIINPNTGYPMLAATEGNIGNPFPDWNLGLRNTLSYKGVTLTALLDIRQGGDVYYGTGRRLKTYGREKITEDREGTYIVPGVLAEVDGGGSVIRDEDGNPVGTSSNNTIQISAPDYYHFYLGDGGAAENAVIDGSWIRLRELALSYRFQNKKDLLPLADYIEVSFTGTNLWLSTDYPGVDPETSLTGAGSNIGGFDYFNNPGSKSFSFGIKVGF